MQARDALHNDDAAPAESEFRIYTKKYWDCLRAKVCPRSSTCTSNRLPTVLLQVLNLMRVWATTGRAEGVRYCV